MDVENKAVTTNTGFLAETNPEAVKTELVKDLTTEKGYTVTAGDKKVTITYVTEDYKSATNKSNASITVDVTLKGNTFTIGDFTYTK